MAITRPTFVRRIRNNIGFLTLFTILTSTSLNCVTLQRERRDERRLHELQCGALLDLYKRLQTITPASSSKITLDQQKLLIKRFQTLKLDPSSIGFSKDILPNQSEGAIWKEYRDKETSWSQALFGSGFVGKLRSSIHQTVSRIRGEEGGNQTSSVVDDQAEAEWIKALEDLDEKENGKGDIKEEGKEYVIIEPIGASDQISDHSNDNANASNSHFYWRTASDEKEGQSQTTSQEDNAPKSTTRRRIII